MLASGSEPGLSCRPGQQGLIWPEQLLTEQLLMPSAALQDGIANHNETYGDFRDLINIDPLRNKAGDVRCAAFDARRRAVLDHRPLLMCLR